MEEYDVVVAGGSISGLMSAREIAKKGYSVLVLEEGFEVGTPDHCGGLVSKSALRDLGIEPSQKTFDCMINTAQIFSPSRKKITMNTKNQEIIAITEESLTSRLQNKLSNLGLRLWLRQALKKKIKILSELQLATLTVRFWSTVEELAH